MRISVPTNTDNAKIAAITVVVKILHLYIVYCRQHRNVRIEGHAEAKNAEICLPLLNIAGDFKELNYQCNPILRIIKFLLSTRRTRLTFCPINLCTAFTTFLFN